jgi:hypothetical protein
MKALDIIRAEIDDYLGGTAQISDGVMFSQHKLYKRISIFKNRHFPKGKMTDLGEYKYWFDIIQPRINNEMKNLRFGSKNILPFSVNPIGDFAAVFTLNAALGEWMWNTGREEELIDSIERFSGEGNVLFKKVKGGYETCDFDNTFIINQSAKTVNETPIVQRAQLTQSELRAKAGVYKNVDKVIEKCGNKFFKKSPRSGQMATTSPMYEIFERNGEISEAALFEARGQQGGDETKYLLARVVVAGMANDKDEERFVLFAEPLKGKMSDYFVEAHRGPYKGRWWREGLYEMLMDHQYRANEIGNQLARGLDWASKVIFKDDSPEIVQNVRTDLQNGDTIRSANMSQVEVRMQGLDQLIADWNRLMEDADRIANSFEVIQGQSLPSGTAFQLGNLLDNNASKLFVMLRGKLGHAYARVYKDFVLPELVKDIKAKDIIRVTGNSDFIDRFRQIAVEGWYLKNLAKIGPHTSDMAKALKEAKLEELSQTEPLIENAKELWDGILSRTRVTITGENYDVSENLQTIASVLTFEQDPVRRAFLLDTIYAAKGIPVPPAVQQGLQAEKSEGPATKQQIESIAKAGLPSEGALV